LDVISGREPLVPTEDLQRQTKHDGDVAPATRLEELVEVDEGGETECGECEPGEAFRGVVCEVRGVGTRKRGGGERARGREGERGRKGRKEEEKRKENAQPYALDLSQTSFASSASVIFVEN
jgi:hypothetical protein